VLKRVCSPATGEEKIGGDAAEEDREPLQEKKSAPPVL
jgi:hypothetical protein